MATLNPISLPTTLTQIPGSHAYANDVFGSYSGSVSDHNRIRDGIRAILDDINSLIGSLDSAIYDDPTGIIKRLEAATGAIVNNATNITSLTVALNSLQTDVADLNAQVSANETDIAQNSTDIAALEQNLATVSSMASSASAQIQTVIDMIASFQQSNVQYLGAFETLADLPPATGGATIDDIAIVGSGSFTDALIYSCVSYAWQDSTFGRSCAGKYPDIASAPAPVDEASFVIIGDTHPDIFGTDGDGAWDTSTAMYSNVAYVVASATSLPAFNAPDGALATVMCEYKAATLGALPIGESGDRAVVTSGTDAGNYVKIGNGWQKTLAPFIHEQYLCSAGTWQKAARETAPMASSAAHGWMPKEAYAQLEKVTTDVEALQGIGSIAENLGAAPTQQQLTDAWIAQKGGSVPPDGATVVNLDQNPPVGHMWTYYPGHGWIDRGAGAGITELATNTTPGIVQGTSGVAGKIFAETDGTLSLVGYDALTDVIAQAETAITTLQNLLSPLAVAKGGTGLTASPSALVNLATTAADTLLKAAPRPGVTGTLPVSNGGTGITSAPSLLTNLAYRSSTQCPHSRHTGCNAFCIHWQRGYPAGTEQ